jgi:serine/threonine protein kinase/tetratricopeptide (TPR) repeat protein
MVGDTVGSADPLIGRLIARKFRIKQLIAAGGMGRVYLAEQVNLGKQVAIKVLRANIAANAELAGRFHREAKSASLLSHPNILQMLDFGDDEGLLFIAMELLVGRDLLKVIAEDRPLPPRRIGHIGAQILAALEEAHANGVVHRDLKPDNIMLLDARGEPDFVKVCDFGLAKLSAERGKKGAITIDGSVCGTPEYMSPEQARGGKVDGRSDLYAVAVMLYQMVTGDVPFRASSALSVLTRQVHDAPEPPSVRVPLGVSPQLEAVILRGLEKKRDRRWATAALMRKALLEAVGAPSIELQLPTVTQRASGADSEGTALPTTPWRKVRLPRRGRWIVLAAAALATLFVGAALRALWLRRATSPASVAPAATTTTTTSRPRRAVAVLGFANLSARPQTAWLSTALAEMLGTELGQSPRLRTVDGQQVARMKAELDLKDADGLGKEALARVRRDLDADLVLLGSYTALDGPATRPLRIDLRVQDTASGETVAAVAEVGSDAELFDLVARIGQGLRSKLSPDSVEVVAHLSRAALPANLEAARPYAEGLAQLRVHDAVAALPLLERAVAADPGHALSRLALAQAWATLGNDGRAEEQAEQALELSSPLGREQRLSIAAYHHMVMHDWPKAIDAYQTLSDFFPDNLDYGLGLAEAQWRGPSPRRALDTLDRLRKLPPPVGDDPRIELARTEALLALGDHQAVVATAEGCKQRARARGADLIAAAAAEREATAWMRLGQCDKTVAAVDEAKAVFARTNDRQAIARAARPVGLCLMGTGDDEGALRVSQKMQASSEEIGDRWGVAMALSQSGNALAELGRRSEALARWEKAAGLFRERNDRRQLHIVLGNIALAHYHQGDLLGSRRRNDETLAAVRRLEDKSFLAHMTLQAAELDEALGDLELAQSTVEEGRALAQQLGERPKIAVALTISARLLADGGRLDEARRQLDDAQALLAAIGDAADLRLLAIDQAALALAAGRGAAATEIARNALAQLDEEHAHGAVDAVLGLHEVLARALVATKQTRAARQELDRALAILPPEPQAAVRLQLAITQADVEAAEGQKSAAVQHLTAAIAEAKKAHDAPLELRARLHELVLLARPRLLDVVRARARALADEAKRRGFVVVAEQAGAIAR